jgi:hypothetical protein
VEPVKPADLRPGHRIACDVPGFEGSLTVVGTWNDIDQANASGFPDAARVNVDVEVSGRPLAHRALRAELGAADSQVLAMTFSGMRYRLYFRPDTEVAVEEA